MSYNTRPRPNVSQYIASLNTIPSNYDPARQEGQLGAEDDLALFLNNDEFFDFDVGEMHNINRPLDFDPAADARSRQQHATAFKDSVFTGGEYDYPDFSSFQNIVPDASAYSAGPSPATAQVPFPLVSQLSSPTSVTSPHSATARPGDKRKLDMQPVDPLLQNGGPIDEQARMAAEEDKRRRNTAASARFRVKKKQREQALEKTAKEMTEKVERLESQVSRLEMENKWLKSLITEKNGGKDVEMKVREGESKRDGVGTVKA